MQLCLQRVLRQGIQGNAQQPAGALVQAVNGPEDIVRGTAEGGEQRVLQGVGRMLLTGGGGQARGLVDDEQMFVPVGDLEVQVHGGDGVDGLRLRQAEGDLVTGLQDIRDRGGHAVHQNPLRPLGRADLGGADAQIVMEVRGQAAAFGF